MNVIIVVLSMLLLLSLMTYARLETYRSSQIFQVLFENYMEKDERGYINLAASKAYDTAKGSTKEGGGGKERVQATPRIPLALLFKKSEADKAPQDVASFNALFKNLLVSLYEKQPFYQEMLEKRPSFVDEMIAALIKAVSELPQDKGLKRTVDIANLKLGDDQLDDVYYKMLHGAPYKDVTAPKSQETKKESAKEQSQDQDDASDQASIEKEAEEHRSPEGYYSMLDFVTLQPSPKIRVYLASREVLKAIYKNDDIVNDIVNKRNELYRQASSTDNEGIKSLSESFKREFDHRQDPSIGDVLDFTVTKTNPKKYQ